MSSGLQIWGIALFVVASSTLGAMLIVHRMKESHSMLAFGSRVLFHFSCIRCRIFIVAFDITISSSSTMSEAANSIAIGLIWPWFLVAA